MKNAVTATKNYTLFDRTRENRPVDTARRKRLRESMQQYGWLRAFPMFVQRNAAKRLTIIDGQHRFEIAKELSLPVSYIEDDTHVDITKIQGGEKWRPTDYAGSFQQRNIKDYERLIEFSETKNMPLTVCASLLAGTVSFANITEAFHDGKFEIKDYEHADKVATIISAIRKCGAFTKKRQYVDAIAACCRAKEFDAVRFLGCVARCPEKMQNFATREAVLAAIEDVYNYGHSKRVGIKAAAENAMRDRNPSVEKQKKAK